MEKVEILEKTIIKQEFNNNIISENETNTSSSQEVDILNKNQNQNQNITNSFNTNIIIKNNYGNDEFSILIELSSV